MSIRAVLVALALALALAGCDPTGPVLSPPAAPVAPPAVSPATTIPVAAARACTLGTSNGQPLPDPACTPGALNPAVTQASIRDTICRVGWTATIRPPTSVTGPLKARIEHAYGLPPGTVGELDHLVSLELGGAAADPANLWVEPGPIPNRKDAVENTLHAAVCAGRIPLAAAQAAIARDWTTATSTGRTP